LIARKLSELQQMDYVLADQRDTLADISSRLEGSRVLILAREKLAAAQGSLQALEKSQREHDVETEDTRARLKKLSDQLYSGQSDNAKELVGLEHEVEALKGTIAAREQAYLELLDKIEKARKAITDATSEVAAAEADWSQDRNNLLHEQEALLRKNEEMESRRREFASGLTAESMAAYRKAGASQKPAVVKLERGRCLGCRIALSMAELQKVRAGGLVLCPNCGRLLYLD
jgi:predicted  nucleic acid-binding Zn-ribbon protein